MDRSELVRRLMATYLEELDEHVATFNRDLLVLEKGPPADERVEVLQSVFRAAHSLKGASRAVDVTMIEQACHAMEDLLVSVRDGERDLTPGLFALLFKAADAIEEAGMRLREEQDLEDAPLAALLPQIEAFDETNEPVATSDDDEITPQTQDAEPAAGDAGQVAGITERAGNAAGHEQVGPEPQEPLPRSPASTSSVRVAADKLDELLAQAGELLVARQRIELGVEELESLRESVSVWRREWRSIEVSLRERTRLCADALPEALLPKPAIAALGKNADRIRQLERDLDRLVTRAHSDYQYLGQVGSAIEDDVHRARMLPFAEACQGLERAIRDVAASTEKQVRLELVGADVQVDRSVLEGLKDPLLHLVRNAVDHGIETPAERQAAGKVAQATITVEAALRGGSVEVRVRDDGGGINLERVAQKASDQGMNIPRNPNELARLIFSPQFSTAATVSHVSGRGVGLDVVRAEVERLHGSVGVTFEPGQWTCFALTVPLTLTTIRAVVVQASGQTFAIPTSSIDRILRFDKTDHATVGGRSVLLTQQGPIALTGLARILGLTLDWALLPNQKMLALVLVSGGQRIAFTVDEIATEGELTVKSLGARVRRLRHVSGATLLASGAIALVLSPANLIRTASQAGERISITEREPAAEPAKRRLLVVDDSVTSRTLLRSILDAAGYNVSVAVDGVEALELVENMPFDLVVCDIDMPRLDGFGFTEAVRKRPGGGGTPIVLVTARDTEQDRARGLEAGANAYIVKSGFNQTQLLRAISNLL